MAPNTAFNFILDSIALLLLMRKSPSGYAVAQIFALLIGLVAATALVGYFLQITSFIGLGVSTQMAINSALAFLLFSGVLLMARPNQCAMRDITSAYAGGVMARRLALAVIGVPIVLDFLVSLGDTAGLYSSRVGNSLLVASCILVLLIIVWSNARSLNRTDVERKEVEDALMESRERFR